MDLSPLENSKNLGQLMVKLHDVYNDYKDDMFGTVFSQNRISDVVEEILLERDITPKEEHLVTEILVTLIREAELKLKAALADRISVIDGAPNQLSLELANDEINVARPILENSTSLSDDDLVYLINTKDSEHWQSIARRRTLDESIINKLADTNDNLTHNSLLKNFNIRLTHYTGKKIAELAKSTPFLAEGLLGRDELSKSIIIDIYQHVGEALQSQIEEKYNYTSDELIKAINDLSSELSSGETRDIAPEEIINLKEEIIVEVSPPQGTTVSSESRSEIPTEPHSKLTPEQIKYRAATTISASGGSDALKKKAPQDLLSPEEYKIAQRYKQTGKLTVSLMTRHLRRRQFKSFIAQLAVFSDLEPALIATLLGQINGQGLAIICHATDLTKADFMNLYLLTQPMRLSRTGTPQGSISKAMDYYSRTNREQSLIIVKDKFKSLNGAKPSEES
jgi:hypothetical protein